MPILLSDEEIIAGVNDGGYAEGGELVSLSEAGKKEYQGVCRAQLKNVVEEFDGYICPECSTPNFVNLVIPLKDWQALKKEAGLT